MRAWIQTRVRRGGRRRVLRRLTGAAVIAAALGAAGAPTASALSCTDRKDTARRLDIRVAGEKTFGYYALPPRQPTGLVVFAHGHGNSAWLWRENVRDAAQRDGVIAVAMDYRGQTFPDPDKPHESFGWRVREGAEDSIAAARLFARRCRRLRTIVMYGVSMGGNTSGLAVAAGATRPGSSRPLFDYWFDIEGATNVIETYLEARLVAGPPLNSRVGQTAVKEIEQEMGGPLESRPDVYRRHAVVTRAGDIKAAGVRGAVIVHAVDDGSVPYNQSVEMLAALRQAGIPTEFFTVGSRGSTPSGNTLEHSTTIGPLLPGYSYPFAGHGGENDLDHLVVKTGFDRLADLFNRGRRPRCDRAFVVDGTAGRTTPEPPAVRC